VSNTVIGRLRIPIESTFPDATAHIVQTELVGFFPVNFIYSSAAAFIVLRCILRRIAASIQKVRRGVFIFVPLQFYPALCCRTQCQILETQRRLWQQSILYRKILCKGLMDEGESVELQAGK